MIKVEQIKNFGGFGSGGLPGEYFHSQGMAKSREGIRPGRSITPLVDESTLTTLGLINWFTEGAPASSDYVFASDDTGDIYQSLGGSNTPTLLYRPGHATTGNGLIIDQKKRLLYAGTQYLGKYDGTSNYTTGTVQVTNGSNAVVGSGTTFTSDMVGKRFLITGETAFYTVATFTDATHITINTNYTGTSGSGKNYTIFTAWTDQWKDFVDSVSDFRSPELYEDWVYFWNGNKIAGLNVTDDSFSDSVFNFPSGFKGVTLKSSSKGILLAANFNNRGVLALWDGITPRSIAPWIWLTTKVKCLITTDSGEWIVITGNGIYLTNGYSIRTINEDLPDSYLNQSSITTNLLPQGAQIVKGKLIFWGTIARPNRAKSGLYLMDLKTGLFEFAPVANECVMGVTGGAVFFDSNYRVHLSYTTDAPSKKVWGLLGTDSTPRSFYISSKLGVGDNDKIAEGVRLNFGINLQDFTLSAITFDVSVKVYNFRRQLYSYAITNATAGATNQIRVDGTATQTNSPKVGDEVTILDGNNAGQIRHIASIANQNLSNETWTLDSALSNATASGVIIGISPFQFVKKHTLTDLTELKDLYFNVKNNIKGKHFLVKIVLENVQSFSVPELNSGQFIYDELPTL